MYFVAWKSQAKTSRGIRLCSSEKSGTGLGLGQRSDGGCRGLQLLLGVAGKRHKPFPAEDDHVDRKCGAGGGRRNEEHMGWLDTSHLPWRMIMWTRNAGERNEEHTGWVDISHFPRRMIIWTGSAGGGG